jgi:hypothetical protein
MKKTASKMKVGIEAMNNKIVWMKKKQRRNREERNGVKANE